MKYGTITKKSHDSKLKANGTNEVLLRSEINFWKDMISACDPEHPLESLERMQQALALAEWRLASVFQDCQDACSSRSFNSLPSNVHSIPSKSSPRLQSSKQLNK